MSFLAPLSTRRALSRESVLLNATLAFMRSRTSVYAFSWFGWGLAIAVRCWRLSVGGSRYAPAQDQGLFSGDALMVARNLVDLL